MKESKHLQEVCGHLLPKSALSTVRKFELKATQTAFTIPKTQVRTSHEAYQMAKHVHGMEGNDIQEFFYVIFLNRANMPTGYYLASIGGISATVADPRLIVKAAALADCCAVVLVHNHPSGAVKPSRADEELTAKLKEAFRFFDIIVLDHIIYATDCYYSFADEGCI